MDSDTMGDRCSRHDHEEPGVPDVQLVHDGYAETASLWSQGEVLEKDRELRHKHPMFCKPCSSGPACKKLDADHRNMFCHHASHEPRKRPNPRRRRNAAKISSEHSEGGSQIPRAVAKSDETGVFTRREIELLREARDIRCCPLSNDFASVLHMFKTMRTLNSGHWNFTGPLPWHVSDGDNMIAAGFQRFFVGDHCLDCTQNTKVIFETGSSSRSLLFAFTCAELIIRTYMYIGTIYKQIQQLKSIFDRTNRLVSMPEQLKDTFVYSGEHHGRACFKSDKFSLAFQDPRLADGGKDMSRFDDEEDGLIVDNRAISFPLEPKLVETEHGSGEVVMTSVQMFIKTTRDTPQNVQAETMCHPSWTIREHGESKVLAQSYKCSPWPPGSDWEVRGPHGIHTFYGSISLDQDQEEIIDERKAMLTERECLFSWCGELKGLLSEMKCMSVFDEFCDAYFVASQMFYKLAEQFRFVIENFECVDGQGSVVVHDGMLSDLLATYSKLEDLVGPVCMPDGSRHCHMSFRSFCELLNRQRLF
eukprot:TRINITY_DN41577_c0_g1_i1.p1 TRINITY_DN41577_c0_g1~~TRINITY_DN41577_c0_g1_i1.p1  ORF type:complete len:532 (-),score=65.61 TRINITY_DN41577_c0_g1_i1:158-1753(-)